MFSVGHVSVFYLLCSFPQPSHAGQLEKGDPDKTSLVQIGACVDSTT